MSNQELQKKNNNKRPLVLSFCGSFLPVEMKHVYRQLCGLQSFEVEIVTRKRENAEMYPFPKEKISILPKAGRLKRGLRRIWYRQLRGRHTPSWSGEVKFVLDLIREKKPDVIHLYLGDFAATLLPVIEKVQKLGVPVITSFHGSDVAVHGMRQSGFSWNIREVIWKSDYVVARSESLRTQLIHLAGNPEKIGIQRTGIPLENWVFQERNEPKEGAWRFLQVGRLVPKKGWATTCKAFHEVLKKHPNSELIICGKGPMEEKLIRFAEQLGVSSRVRFLGFLDENELLEEMKKAHLYLHPSETTGGGDAEGVPNSMLEAMATGLPVCATFHGGIPEAIVDGKSGLLVPEGDDQKLAEAIGSLLENKILRDEIGKQGRQSVEEGFDRCSQIKKLEKIYEQVIKKKSNTLIS